jgi:hypothetical protein
METTNKQIIQFLTWMLEKENTPETDRLVFILTVLQPDLYKKAMQAIFPYRNSSPGVELSGRLRSFLKEHELRLAMPSGRIIMQEQVDFDEVILHLFL